jgi:hypothetical protein
MSQTTHNECFAPLPYCEANWDLDKILFSEFAKKEVMNIPRNRSAIGRDVAGMKPEPVLSYNANASLASASLFSDNSFSVFPYLQTWKKGSSLGRHWIATSKWLLPVDVEQNESKVKGNPLPLLDVLLVEVEGEKGARQSVWERCQRYTASLHSQTWSTMPQPELMWIHHCVCGTVSVTNLTNVPYLRHFTIIGPTLTSVILQRKSSSVISLMGCTRPCVCFLSSIKAFAVR